MTVWRAIIWLQRKASGRFSMEASAPPSVLGAGLQRILLRLAACIVPATSGAPAEVESAMLSAIDAQLVPRPRLQQLEFKLLLLGLSGMTLLPMAWQARFLRWLENFPIRLVRVGIWGLKTLVYLGYYGQEGIQHHIGYLPGRRDGNDRLHAGIVPSIE
jgi:hypothetical protein